MRKKIVSIICSFIMLVSLATVPVKAAVDAAKISNAYTLLSKLGIADATINANNYGEEITRAQFSIYASRIVDDFISQDKQGTYYNDVPLDFWGLKEINTLVEAGALTVPENRIFRPDAVITKAEAVKIILCLMQYSHYSDLNGGFSAGYMQIAYENDLMDNLSAGDKMTYQDTLMLIYNALEIPMSELIYSTTSLYEDETLLSYYFDGYSVEGQVTSVGGISLSGPCVYSGYVAIDEEIYYLSGLSAEAYLGQKIKAFVVDNSGDDIDSVIAIEVLDKKNDVLTISKEDIVDVDFINYTIEYQEGNKSKKADLSQGIMVMKNGERVSRDLDAAFTFDKGVLKLIDYDKDGNFDYAFIDSYRNIVASFIDTEEQIVYDELNPLNKISLADYNDKDVHIFNGGKAGTFSNIAVGSVLSVFDSENYVRIEISTKTVSGTLFEISEDDKVTKVTVGARKDDAEVLKLAPEYLGYAENMLRVGASVTFKCDYYGDVAFGSVEVDSEYKYAYVKRILENVDTDGINIQLFTQDSEHVTYICPEKLRIDGGVLKGKDKQEVALLNYVGMVIRFKADGENIIEIDAPVENDEMSGFHKTESVSGRYSYSGVRFGMKLLCSDNTVFFVVPSDVENYNEAMYAVVKKAFFINGKSYSVEGYKLDNNQTYENVLVTRTNDEQKQIGNQYMFLVDTVSKQLGASGEVVNVLTGYTDGSKKTYELSEDCLLTLPEGFTTTQAFPSKRTLDKDDVLESGDMIVITGMNMQDQITSWEPLFPDYSYIDEWELGHYTANTDYGLVYLYGNVVDTANNVLKISFTDLETVDEVFDLTKVSVIYVYDSEMRGSSKIRKGTKADLIPSKGTNSDCSKITARVSNGGVTWVVVYK